MNPLRRARYPFFALLCLIGTSVITLAQTPGQPLDERLSKLETAAASAQSAGDNAWVLVCAALVLMMTGPGLALFYGGLVRKKNVLATMMQSFVLMAVVTVLWALYGYSIAFAEGTQFFGNLSYALLPAWGPRLRGLCRDHPAADLCALPIDVCNHHSGSDYGRLC